MIRKYVEGKSTDWRHYVQIQVHQGVVVYFTYQLIKINKLSSMNFTAVMNACGGWGLCFSRRHIRLASLTRLFRRSRHVGVGDLVDGRFMAAIRASQWEKADARG